MIRLLKRFKEIPRIKLIFTREAFKRWQMPDGFLEWPFPICDKDIKYLDLSYTFRLKNTQRET